ncbi:hypothetical protein [Baekduia sp. Peel2402]|uniref:hypothetical protein n=1 Tax=Baekduia sp. Peel2402 TaxID=3458296 RepID=UPI00403EF43F
MTPRFGESGRVPWTADAGTPSGAPTAVLVQPDGTTMDFGTDIKGCLTYSGPVAWSLSSEETKALPFCRIDSPAPAPPARHASKKASHHRAKKGAGRIRHR